MKSTSSRQIWALVALGSAGLVVASLALTAWLGLHPCHLCIFQRVLFMVLAVLGGLAAWRWQGALGLVAGLAVLPVTAGGIAAAGYQSWLQAFPVSTISCGASTPGVIETFVEHLGSWLPSLFLATGNCADEELVVLGLSLANWSALAFMGSLLVAGWALLRCRSASRRA